MVIKPMDKVPIYLQLEEHIRELIDSKRLRPGDRVPSEAELATAHGISRMTVRKALDRLEMDGVIVRRAGKGTFVAEPKIVHGASTIFSFSANLSAAGYETRAQMVERRVVEPEAGIRSRLGLNSESNVIEIGRVRFIGDDPVALNWDYLPYPRYAAIMNMDVTRDSILKIIADLAGSSRLKSSDELSISLARPIEAELLRIREGSPVFVVQGITYDDTDRPVKYSKAIYRGDRFLFVPARNPG
ncbi:MAG: GntR family transcriptional regulator [Firmicutes bacterium]|nr:GntR family transcriptional regulator [Bacillota bacterium]